MAKKPKNKVERIGQAVVMALFVMVSAVGSLSLLDYINLTTEAEAVVGYGMGAFAALVFGYIAWKSVSNE